MIFYIPVLGECWQFEFSHVLGELLCEARNVFLRALKKRRRDGRGKYDVLSFISYFSFSLD